MRASHGPLPAAERQRGHRRIATIASALRHPDEPPLPLLLSAEGTAASPVGGLFINSYAGLPDPRRGSELVALCRDVDLFGYCIIRDALPPSETASLARRTAEQAAAELRLNLADPASTRQQVESLVNKGDEFVQLVDHPSTAPVLQHILGTEMLLSVHNAIISKPAASSASAGATSTARPMPLHTDQWWMPQPQQRTCPPRIRAGSVDRAQAHTAEWGAEIGGEGSELQFIAPPVAAQCIWMASDFCEANGATWVTPGSHLSGRLPTPEEANNHALASAVALECRAGTCVVYDARLWHGTGLNSGGVLNRETGLDWRLGIFTMYCAPWARQAENVAMGALPEVPHSAAQPLCPRSMSIPCNVRRLGRSGSDSKWRLWHPGGRHAKHTTKGAAWAATVVQLWPNRYSWEEQWCR